MEKDRSFKVMSIAALLVGVVGISLGFAAFNTSLTINGTAQVSPTDSTFAGRVYFAAAGATAESAEPGVVSYTGTNGCSASSDNGLALDIECAFGSEQSATVPEGSDAENFTGANKVVGVVKAYVLNDSPFTATVTTENVFAPTCTGATGNELTACQNTTLVCTGLEKNVSIASGALKEVVCTVTFDGATYPVDDQFTVTYDAITYGFQSAA